MEHTSCYNIQRLKNNTYKLNVYKCVFLGWGCWVRFKGLTCFVNQNMWVKNINFPIAKTRKKKLPNTQLRHLLGINERVVFFLG